MTCIPFPAYNVDKGLTPQNNNFCSILHCDLEFTQNLGQTPAWIKIDAIDWANLSHDDFAKSVARLFPALWQTHPFREGNTRTVVMLIALFAEHCGYYFDYELMAASAGYVRNAFVLCCFGERSEFEHLEKILCDAISTEPIEDSDEVEAVSEEKSSKYEKYYTNDYRPTPHEYVEGK